MHICWYAGSYEVRLVETKNLPSVKGKRFVFAELLQTGILLSMCENPQSSSAWWRHEMETFFALLVLCAGNSPVTVEFPSQKPVTRSLDVFFDLRMNNGWINNRGDGDLRRHGAHYDVIVMNTYKITCGFNIWYSNEGLQDITFNTLRPRHKGILQRTLWSALCWMKIIEFWLRFHWNLCPRVHLTIWHHY